MSGVHDGHRQRLKARFLREGLDHFEPHNVLELLLFYAVPYKDTNELAHRLIERFGSLAGVLNADYAELIQVNGVRESTATLLKLIPDLARRYVDDCDTPGLILGSIDEIGAYLQPKFIGRTREQIYLLCLDSKGSVAFADFIIEGSINSAPMYTRNIVEIVMRSQAVSVVLAHNHPNGIAVPSTADITSTQAIYNALSAVKVRLLDHFIFAGSDYVSLRDSGFFSFEG